MTRFYKSVNTKLLRDTADSKQADRKLTRYNYQGNGKCTVYVDRYQSCVAIKTVSFSVNKLRALRGVPSNSAAIRKQSKSVLQIEIEASDRLSSSTQGRRLTGSLIVDRCDA